MQFSTSIPMVAIALAASILVAACGGSDPGGPTAAATVSGVVKAATGAVIEGASVRIESAAATTGADGRFELRNLPVGSATIMTSAPRFEARSESVSLTVGTNAHDVVLAQQTIFTHQDVLAYLPPGIAEYRAAIVFLPGLRDPATGNDLDSRGLVRGTSDAACSIWCLPGERAEVRRRALELAGGNVALIGTTTLVDNAASYATLLQALSELGTQSLHPELANIPIFFVGHSMGGCTAYGFSRVHGARVAGFMTMKGGCHNTGTPAAAAAVPGYFLIGALDAQFRRENITAAFEAGRAAGAPWAVSIDALEHHPIADIDLMFDWIDAVLAARLPATAGAPLRAMTETTGWLGDRSTGAISTYGCYGSTRSSASWLPSRETALNWQRMAGGTVMVSAC
jgi:pimeloyl-ACP methyl ester carboxylesterase